MILNTGWTTLFIFPSHTEGYVKAILVAIFLSIGLSMFVLFLLLI